MNLSKNSLPYSMSGVAKETSTPTLGNDSLQTGMTSPTGKQYIEYNHVQRDQRGYNQGGYNQNSQPIYENYEDIYGIKNEDIYGIKKAWENIKSYKLEPKEFVIDEEELKKRYVYFVGDLHGDVDKAMELFKLVKLVDDDYNWKGDNSYVIVTGDFISKGLNSFEVITFLLKIHFQAKNQNGKVILLMGNHEFMVYTGYYRFVQNDKTLKAILYDSKFKDLKKVLIQFFERLSVAIRVGSILASHSGLNIKNGKDILMTNQKFKNAMKEVKQKCQSYNSSTDNKKFMETYSKSPLTRFKGTYIDEHGGESPIWNTTYIHNSGENNEETKNKITNITQEAMINAQETFRETNCTTFVLAHYFPANFENPHWKTTYFKNTQINVIGIDFNMSRYANPYMNERYEVLVLNTDTNLLILYYCNSNPKELQFISFIYTPYKNPTPQEEDIYYPNQGYANHRYNKNQGYGSQEPTRAPPLPPTNRQEEEEDIWGVVVPRGSQTGAPEEVKEEDDTPQEEDIWGAPPRKAPPRKDIYIPKYQATRALPSLPTTHYPNQGYAPLPPKRKSSLNDDQANHHYPSNHHQGYGSQEKRQISDTLPAIPTLKSPHYGIGQRTRFY